MIVRPVLNADWANRFSQLVPSAAGSLPELAVRWFAILGMPVAVGFSSSIAVWLKGGRCERIDLIAVALLGRILKA
ncbi:MAG: hypothetical protein CMM01_26295 [Rhodopirellula sp.]|nr:hypothetical protein [Rhodopirellula sp.]